MGMVLLDVTFRVERAFGIDMPRDGWSEMGIQRAGDDVTVGQYHAYIRAQCEAQGKPIPTDSWPVLVRLICDASGCRENEITPQTWLIKDIAPCG